MKHMLADISNGLLLVYLGIMALLYTLGFLHWHGMWQLNRWWPLLLVAAGLSVLTRRALPFSLALLILLVLVSILLFYLGGLYFVCPGTV